MSRRSITRVRDAFAELVKELATEELRAFVASNSVVAVGFGLGPATVRLDGGPATGAAECTDPSFLTLALVHLHDEAALRLRSHLHERLTQAPSRSRGSNVLQCAATGAMAAASDWRRVMAATLGQGQPQALVIATT